MIWVPNNVYQRQLSKSFFKIHLTLYDLFTGNAIKRLQAARLYPIAIFLKPKDPMFILAMNDRMTDDQADKAFARAMRLEHDFINYFTAIINGNSFDEIYDKVKTVIKTHSKNTIWVPANEMFQNKNKKELLLLLIFLGVNVSSHLIITPYIKSKEKSFFFIKNKTLKIRKTKLRKNNPKNIITTKQNTALLCLSLMIYSDEIL